MKKSVFLLLLISSLALLFSQSYPGYQSGSPKQAKAPLAEVQSDKLDNTNVSNPQVYTPENDVVFSTPEAPMDGTRATRTASVSGYWNATATWGGSAVPVAGDAVTINSGITVTVSAAAACTSITFAAVAANSAITISGTNTLTVSGAVSMPRPSASKTCTINVNAGTLTCGSLTMSATTTTRNDVINVTTGSMTVSGTLTTGTTGCRFIFTGAGTLDLQGTRTNSPTIIAVSGSTVKIGTGTLTATNFTAMTLPAGSNLVYSGGAAQTIYATTYLGNLGLSGAGTKTIAASTTVTVNGNLTNSSTLVMTAGTSTTSTWLVMGGNVTNTGTITATADYIRFIFDSTNAQTFTNNGTMTAPVSSFDVANTSASGLTIAGTNNIVITRANLFEGTVVNSNKLTLGNGGTTWATVQRGVSSSTSPAGRFDVYPSFNIGSGGLTLLYDNGSVAYSTGYEVPLTNTIAGLYVFDAADVTLNSDLNISEELNFYGGTGTPILRMGANTLTIDGTIVYTVAGSFVGGTSSNLVLNGSTTLNAITSGLNNLTVNANVTLGGAVTVNNTLTLSSGIFINSSNLTMASGSTISRSAGSLSTAPTFSGTVNLLYTGSSAIVAGKELPTGASVINNLTTNPGGFTQYAYTLGTATNLLTEAFPSLTGWTGDIGSGDGYFNSNASVNAGGTTPEVRFTGSVTSPYPTSNKTFYIYKTSAVSTTGYTTIDVSFKTMSTGSYTQSVPTYMKLQCATSTSGPWSDVWSVGYSVMAAQTITVPSYSTNVGGDMYFQFAFVGDYYCLDYWYFDNLSVNGVPVIPVASNITVNGTLNLTGNYTIGSGNTLTMANNATINRSAGTLSAAPTFGTNVNLIYSGTSSFTTGVENPGTGINNLSVTNSSGVSLDKNTTVGGTLALTTGLGIGANTLTINGSISGSGGLTGGGSSHIVFGGAGASTALPAVTLSSLTLNRANGISLGGAVTTADITFTSGSITLGNYNLTATGTITGTPSLIINGSGVATGFANESNPPVVNCLVVNPVSLPTIIGDLNINAGSAVTLPNNIAVTNLTLTNPLDFNGYTLTLTGKDIKFGGSNGISALSVTKINSAAEYDGGTNSIDRRWAIAASSTGDVTITLSWPSSADNGNTFAADCYAWRYNGTIWQAVSPVTVNTTDPRTASFSRSFVTKANQAKDAEGEFTISGEGHTLPVELSSFTAQVNYQNLVTLQWVTQSETNVSGYRVYRSASSGLDTAEQLSVFIPGTNTSNTQSYLFTDTEVLQEGVYYYWLENLDMDGSSAMHGPAIANVTSSQPPTPEIPIVNGLSNAYPNPFSTNVTLKMGLVKAGLVDIVIYNQRGQKVRKLISMNIDKGVRNLNWDGKDDFGNACSSGVYLVRMKINGGESSQLKMLLMK